MLRSYFLKQHKIFNKVDRYILYAILKVYSIKDDHKYLQKQPHLMRKRRTKTQSTTNGKRAITLKQISLQILQNCFYNAILF